VGKMGSCQVYGQVCVEDDKKKRVARFDFLL